MKIIIRLKNGGSKIYLLNEASILAKDGTIEIAFAGDAGGFASHRVATQARSKEPAKSIDIELLITANDVVVLYEI